ncbi:MAG: asparagine--tRNA ligase [Candidatus Marinimicrobia bacterium]|nr:asparagine--tRNA ligase [Candidatus Neomarinimicrobiota bacterium]
MTNSDRIRIRDLLPEAPARQAVRVAGWVRTRRAAKGDLAFIELNDGSCFAGVQIVVPPECPAAKTLVPRLYPGSAIEVEGAWVPSAGREQAAELLAERITLLGACDPTAYPLQKQRISFERLRELPHLRPRTNTFGAVARLRDTLAAATHQFFRARGFLHLHTPIITTSDCEGAGALFQVTTLPLDRPPRRPDGAVDYQQDFFGRAASLTVSGQLAAEAYACALGAVYTFGPTFRAEDSNTRRHLAEFWMVEPEMAFADLAADAALAEAYLKHLARAVLDECPDEIAFFTARIEPLLRPRLETLATATFTRLTYTEGMAALARAPGPFTFPVTWGQDLQTEHERYLTEEFVKGPVIVSDYPRGIKPFYMRLNDDGQTVAAMDVLLPGIGEIIGGSQREERLEVLTERLCAAGLDPADYEWYLDLRRFGTVPHAGFGLGFERLVQVCSGLANIRDAMPFPRTPRNALC